jgi:uncharacterized peroxidase-related enzyme
MTEREPFIPYASLAAAPPSLRAQLESYQERMGFLPNALRFYLHRPEIAEVLFRLNDAIMRDPSSTLDQGLKRKLGAVASKINGCQYCTTHHSTVLSNASGFGAEGWDLSEAELSELLEGRTVPKDDFETACFDFVRLASTAPTAMPDEIFARLQVLLSPAQIVELAAVVGFWKMYNTIHDCLDIPIEQALLERSVTVGIP